MKSIIIQSTEPELYVSHRQLVGVFAQWAIVLNPIFPPRNIQAAIANFFHMTLEYFKVNPEYVVGHSPTKRFANRSELRAYLEPALKGIPEIMDWNKSQNESDGIASSIKEVQVQFIWGGSAELAANDDFVDIGALTQNIANYFHFDAVRNQDFDAKFKENHPDPAAITSAFPIKMRDDGELPKKQKHESFLEWVERISYTAERDDTLNGGKMKVYLSRIDGGYLGGVPGDFKWLYSAGIREAIQMMDQEPDKAVSIGFNPNEQKWYGWGRATLGFGIGYVAEKGDSVTTSGWDAEYLAQHPEKDFRVPIGFTAKTLLDCKRLAIAFAESVS